MKIKILYDNRTIGSGILAGWGFSCLVDNTVLFDMGENGSGLLNNIKNMKIDIENINNIVISHDHWDHTGGLEFFLKIRKNVTVYGCKGFSFEFKNMVNLYNAELIEERYLSPVKGNVYTTGVFTGEYKGNKIEEQALVVKTFNGITIITGCAHPGIVRMVKYVKELFPQERIYCVLGGFHLKATKNKEIISVVREFKALGVEKTGPAHCSGDDAISIFKKEYKSDFIQIEAGKEIEV